MKLQLFIGSLAALGTRATISDNSVEVVSHVRQTEFKVHHVVSITLSQMSHQHRIVAESENLWTQYGKHESLQSTIS